LTLLVVLVANILYAFWGVRLSDGLTSPGTKPRGRNAQSGQYTAGWAALLHLTYPMLKVEIKKKKVNP
jgi:hypothetical protein